MRIITVLLLTALAIPVAAPAMAESFQDPVAYCRAVGTIDKPDARYTGAKLPGWMAAKLHLEPDQAKMMEWRCADGAVLACLYGANIPCDSRADVSRTPTEGIAGYCRENPGSDFVPDLLNQVAGKGFARWEVNGTQSIFGKAFPPFGLVEGTNFMEVDLVYLSHDLLFWGARNIDGRGFDKEENRPTNLQIPLARK